MPFRNPTLILSGLDLAECFQSLIRDMLFRNKQFYLLVPPSIESFNRSFAICLFATNAQKLAHQIIDESFNRSFAICLFATSAVKDRVKVIEVRFNRSFALCLFATMYTSARATCSVFCFNLSFAICHIST